VKVNDVVYNRRSGEFALVIKVNINGTKNYEIRISNGKRAGLEAIITEQSSRYWKKV